MTLTHAASSGSIHIQVSPATSTTANAGGTMRPVVDNPTPHRLPEGENAAPLEVIGTTAVRERMRLELAFLHVVC